jgi:cysteine desulfurase
MSDMARTIYLDYAATTPVRPEVRTAMEPYVSDRFGNPSSLHAYGREARGAVEEARDRIRGALGSPDARVVFTGSGSEADNLAILGFALRHPDGCLVRSSVEHKAVIGTARSLEATTCDVRVAPVDARGVLDLAELERLLPDDGRPTLVSVMWANNETGVVQPVGAVADLCRSRGAAFHSDAVQAFGKTGVRPRDIGVDLLALSAHKLGGPKGVGALVIRDGLELEPIVHGGGQESGLRSGTENVAGIVGFAAAADLAADELTTEPPRWRGLRDRLEAGLRESVPELVINGGDAPERLPHVVNVSVPDVDIEGLITALDLEGICVSTGSACTTGSVEPSHVMKAMGREGDLARNTIRLSLGWSVRDDDIDRTLDIFPRVVRRVRELAART